MMRSVIRSVPFLTAVLALLTAAACAGSEASEAETPRVSYRVIGQWPHAIDHFTQGLLIHDGRLFESTGGYGHSAVYEKELRTGRVLRMHRLPPGYFGEGLALHVDRLIQLTWRERTAFIYDLQLRLQDRVRREGESWGLTFDGRHLILSDGTSALQRLHPESLRTLVRIPVQDQGRPVHRLNELEYVDGLLYANVWHSDRIAIIEPTDGRVLAWLDLSELRSGMRKPPDWDPAEDVLNGIAWDPDSGHLFITGKRWPALYELKVTPPRRSSPINGAANDADRRR